MTGKIVIEFDTDAGKLWLGAPLSNEAEKMLTIRMLAAAIPIAVDYKDPAIIVPKPTTVKPVVH